MHRIKVAMKLVRDTELFKINLLHLFISTRNLK